MLELNLHIRKHMKSKKKNHTNGGLTNGNGKTFAPQPHFIPMEEGTILDGIRKDVFLDRYSLKDVDGRAVEAFPEQMWRRVSW